MSNLQYVPEIQEVLSSGKALSVLVVDDTKAIRSAIREVLELGNLLVAEADSGKQALAMAANELPDLVLLDMDMPETDGISILKTLRRSYSKLELPIILVASKSASSELIHALDCGANDYITRPIDFDVLWTRSSNQLMQKQAASYLCTAQANFEKLITQRTSELKLSNRELKKEIETRLSTEDILKKQANYDELTGLPNRNLATDRLHQALVKAKRYHTRPCLAFLDLDNFKYVNDTFGHAAGDDLLKEVATRLSACARESDTVARLGGDEFLMILDDSCTAGRQLGEPEIRCIGERIIKSFSLPFAIEGHDLDITPSLGFAIYPEDGTNSDSLMRHADMAMYRSKNDGKNRYCFYSPGLPADSELHTDIETELRHALNRDEFSIVYQPIVNPENGKIAKAEALLRWHSGNLGTISPDNFIPAAEESGLISPIGKWVFKTVCKQLKLWHQLGYSDVPVTINISAGQLGTGLKLVEIIRKSLANNDLPSNSIQLELTEDVLLQETVHASAILKLLEEMGVKIVIDDFGTSYASLTCLQRYNVDCIKIDRSHISNILESRQDEKLVNGIIAMSKCLGIPVVSEGVENKDQLDFLMKANCDYVQGYFFSKPVSSDELTALMKKTNQQRSRPGTPALA